MKEFLTKTDKLVTSLTENSLLAPLLIALLCLPAIFALFKPGFFGVSDDIHIAWIYEMFKTLQAGQIPPRYVPDLSFGFGYPLFNFVFPLPYYIGSLFHLIGFSLVASLKLIFGFSIVLSAIFMFWLLKKLISAPLALFGSVLYTYTPYRAVDLYKRGDLGEIVAFVFLPLITLSVVEMTDNLSSQRRWLSSPWIYLGAISLAGLILSHEIASYMFLPFVVVLALLRVLTRRKFHRELTAKILVFLCLGLAVSLYFWLPALGDSQLMKYDTVFDYKNNFPSLTQLVAPLFGKKIMLHDPYEGDTFFLGSLDLFVIAVGIIGAVGYWKKLKGKRLIFLWGMATYAIAVFMMNYRSSFLWSHIPLLPYFQFPWRFLIMTTFVTPLFLIPIAEIKYGGLAVVVLIPLTILVNYSFFRPHDFLLRDDSYYLNRYIPVPVASTDYKQTKEEYLRLPLVTSQRPDQNYPPVFPQEPTEVVTVAAPFQTTVLVNAKFTQTLNFSKYSFPGWVAAVNGQPTTITPGQPFGQVSVILPPGQAVVDLKFTETPFKKLLDLVSFGTLLFSLGMIYSSVKKRS